MASHPEVVALVVLAAMFGVLVLSARTGVPYPVVLVVAGLALGLAPGMPELRIQPDVILLGVLPPLLFWPAYLSSARELRRHARAILQLALALVLATTAAVAVFAHAVIGLDWGVAFVLGAVVSATDPVAATATLQRVGAPRAVSVVLEGESLVNDAAALVAYTVAVEAVVTGHFSPGETAARFVLGAVAGVAIGLAVGRLLEWTLQRLREPLNAITLVLFAAYFAYLPAELAGASGVLAAVAAGLYFGWVSPRLHVPDVRIAGTAFWEELVFLLNALVFFAIGLQLPSIVDGVREFDARELALWTAAVVGVAIVVRIVWVYAVVCPHHDVGRRSGDPAWRECTIKAWAGMRGVVSIAAALAIPLTTDAGRPFPQRDLVIFVAYGTVIATLVVQGITLPSLIRALGLRGRDRAKDDAAARAIAAEAALRRASELEGEPWVPPDCLDRLRAAYERRRAVFGARADGGRKHAAEDAAERCTRLHHELLDAESDTLLELRERGELDEEVYRDMQRELDLAHLRLGA